MKQRALKERAVYGYREPKFTTLAKAVAKRCEKNVGKVFDGFMVINVHYWPSDTESRITIQVQQHEFPKNEWDYLWELRMARDKAPSHSAVFILHDDLTYEMSVDDKFPKKALACLAPSFEGLR
jgi:hypothetical protein